MEPLQTRLRNPNLKPCRNGSVTRGEQLPDLTSEVVPFDCDVSQSSQGAEPAAVQGWLQGTMLLELSIFQV
jgi:hypothetical protein